jgi:TPR repeat protein
VGLAESELRRGQNDIAIARVLPLCQQSVVEACFAAAKFLKQRKLATRHGQSSADLTAKGMTILDERCAANNTDGCLQLGRILLAGKVVPKDPKRGYEVVAKACTAKNIRACAFLGSMYVAGEGVKKDVRRGAKLLEEACAGGGSNACAALANTLVKSDKKRAGELYAKACKGDDGEGCAKSGNVTRACELEHAESCMAAGAKETDLIRQRAAYQRACDAAISVGCAALAPLVATGKGGPRDYGGGLELADRACNDKVVKACAIAKELRASPPAVSCTTVEACAPLCDDEKIPAGCRALAEAELAVDKTDCHRTEDGLEKACRLGDAMSCIERGHVEDSYVEATTWYGLGCQAQHTGACALEAFSSMGKADYKKSLTTLAKACKTNVGGACALYGELVRIDKPVEGARLLQVACDAKNGRACRVLASMYDRDDTRIPELHKRSCASGDPIGCALVKDPEVDINSVQGRCMIDFNWMP